MSGKDAVEELEEKLRQLTELRRQEEEKYGEVLTLLDRQCAFPLPSERSAALNEVKEKLNRAWDTADGAFDFAQAEDRIFWKEVSRAIARYLEPYVKRQAEFNSNVVQLTNELVDGLVASLSAVREFHTTLMLYFQRLIPVIDTKFREAVGIEDKNVLVNLQNFEKFMHEFQKHISEAARDHADLLFQQLDRRMETVQIDSKEHKDSLDSLGTSVRSLHHLANAWKTAREKGKPAPEDAYRYFHFEENFRGTREQIKEKFIGYVQHFRNGKAPVLDLGCGRGEFLELMKEASIPAIGVDSNHTMVENCKNAGLQVEEGDLLEFLQSRKENSLGGIFCSQVVEHLPPDYLLKLLDAAFSRLQDGAPILLETVNIGSAFAFLQVYTKDLTHRTPVHPDTLKFVVAACGFRNAAVLYTSPVPAVAQLKLFPDASNELMAVFNQNMQKLNRLLYDPQEYAVLAVK